MVYRRLSMRRDLPRTHAHKEPNRLEEEAQEEEAAARRATVRRAAHSTGVLSLCAERPYAGCDCRGSLLRGVDRLRLGVESLPLRPGPVDQHPALEVQGLPGGNDALGPRLDGAVAPLPPCRGLPRDNLPALVLHELVLREARGRLLLGSAQHLCAPELALGDL